MNQYFAFFCGIRFMTKFGYERGKNLCSKSYSIKNRKITRKKAIFLVPTNKTQNVTQKWKKKTHGALVPKTFRPLAGSEKEVNVLITYGLKGPNDNIFTHWN